MLESVLVWGLDETRKIIELFNWSFRDKCLNTHWFLSVDDAREKVETWRRDYYEFRPHSALGYRTPIQAEENYEFSRGTILNVA